MDIVATIKRVIRMFGSTPRVRWRIGPNFGRSVVTDMALKRLEVKTEESGSSDIVCGDGAMEVVVQEVA
jgi:hypothetical protein